MTINCPIIITVTEPQLALTCYRGHKIYHPGAPIAEPPWQGQDISKYYLVYFNNYIYNVTGDKPYWIARTSLADAKTAIDGKIANETNYKTRFPESDPALTRPLIEEGDQC